MSELNICMLGTFSITKDGQTVDDRSNRMRKVWLLLAYLIYTRKSRSTQDNYLALLQGSKAEAFDDPSGRLKALFYRARTMLDQVYPGAGHELILRQGGSYGWNNQIPLRLDVEEFETLCNIGRETENEDQKLDRLLQALALYPGDFLPKLSMEHWVMPIAAYYHKLYLEVAEQALSLLQARSRWADMNELCRKALKIEPYSEELYQHLMRSLLAMGDRENVLNTYEQMSELLFDTFGVMPSDESRRLYREASKLTNDQSVPIGVVKDQLREPTEAKGAVFCEYDFFRLLYQVQARAVIRSGDTIHIALLSVRGANQKSLARKSLDIAMENLKNIAISNLRQGDVVSLCSMSQLVLMLPQANYENSCMVCQRICKAFARQFPHSPAEIHYHVQPLEPKLPEHMQPV